MANSTTIQNVIPWWTDNTYQIWDYFPTTTQTLATYWNEQAKTTGSFPPYNLLTNKDNSEFILSMAVAGFSPDDLDVSVKDKRLIIKGEVIKKEEPEGFSYSHKGIAERSFTRQFTLGEYVEVQDVSYNNGVLNIKLTLVIPESKKPKKFAITSK